MQTASDLGADVKNLVADSVHRKKWRHGARARCGFSLVEIMIVVGIVGLLTAVALPSFMKARRQSRVSRMMNDLRVVYDAFNLYAANYGDYPDGLAIGSMTPAPVAEFLDGARWSEETVMGGQWLYYRIPSTDTPLVIIDDFNFEMPVGPIGTAEDWQLVDERIDDGNLGAGRFRLVAGVQVQYSLNDQAW